MNEYRFAKLPSWANDPTRRYRVLRGEDLAGEAEVSGNASDGDTLVLTVKCQPSLTEVARDEVLTAARRFVDELAAGWGVQVAEAGGGGDWAVQPEGGSRAVIEFRAT